MKDWSKILRNLTMLSQLGLSLLMPLLLCMFGCYMLNTRAGVPVWIYIPGMILGLGSSGMTAYKTYLAVMRKEKKTDGSRTAFNEHR
ncbi:MAG: AtpZ/AtpI family protein [Lachnospiraceae bacterium]|nr:AtpZ/AtpI family protein [Lachnospiraceae bacterium]